MFLLEEALLNSPMDGKGGVSRMVGNLGQIRPESGRFRLGCLTRRLSGALLGVPENGYRIAQNRHQA